MSAILKQRNLLATQEFEITDKSLKTILKTPVSYFENEFTFEEITKKYLRKKSVNLYTFIPAVLFTICIIVTICSHFFQEKGSSWDDILLYAILAAVFIIVSIFNIENVVKLFLIDGRFLSFYGNSPNKQDVDAFLERLFFEKKLSSKPIRKT
jgi:hypothetical protein